METMAFDFRIHTRIPIEIEGVNLNPESTQLVWNLNINLEELVWNQESIPMKRPPANL